MILLSRALPQILAALWLAASTFTALGGASSPFVSTLEELDDPAKAEWIAPPEAIMQGSGLYLFRKTIDLEFVPDRFPAHVTADPRYKLYVNGRLVMIGPAAGDHLEWRYATIDLADSLKVGRNLIALELWDAGPHSGTRQASIRTGMLLEGPDYPGGSLQSDRTWKVNRSSGWQTLPMDSATVGGGYIAGATEQLDASKHPWGWNTDPDFDDSAWSDAIEIGKGSHGGLNTWLGTPWTLRERPIPLLEMESSNVGRLRASEPESAALTAEEVFPLTVQAGLTRRLLFDRGVIGVGFPRLTTSGGAGSRIRLRYQEALFNADGSKGNRDDLEGKVMKGYYDELFLGGALRVTYEPAWIRTYRYLELTIEAGAEDVILERLDLLGVGYPFRRKGGFESSDGALESILEACWNTVDVCALETYMDCPYYEQVQYIGDTRIQALISLYMTGDDRLMRNAIQQFNRSRQYNGLTASAFPVRGREAPQLIPPFSLVYVSMVHDFFLHREDPEFVRPLLPGIRFTLEWFLERLDERGLLGPLPYWNHTDGGAKGFHHGSPPGATTGGSIQLSLLLVAALDDAANLFDAFQGTADAQSFRQTASRIREAVNRHGYDEARGLYSETPEKQVFSQHTNAYAILTKTAPGSEIAALAERLVSEADITQGSLYFQFYVFNALREAGRGDLMLPELDRWREMLAAGLTTFPEHGIESRSDAHAWAAHPLYHLLATTAGITPAEPGFARVRIRPTPGRLEWIRAAVCHPQGVISLRYRRLDDGRREFEVDLPGSLEGVLEWEGRLTALRPGRQSLSL